MANIIWEPQEKQICFLERPEYEVLYGGAAGGGKSDALLVEALRQVHIPHYRGILFRKTYPQLSELIDRSLQLYPAAFPKARFHETKHCWIFPSGAKIFFGAMQHSKDKTNYQGKRYDFIGFDELTHFTWEEYSYLFSRNRPSKRPGSDWKTRCYIRATTNPGGIGHGWVKQRFLDAGEPGKPIVEDVEIRQPDGTVTTIQRDRVFIPATVFDNRALLRENPEYLGSLALLPEKERNALLYGNWDTFAGQYNALFEEKKQEYYLEHEAEDSIASSVTSKAKGEYLDEDISRTDAKSILTEYGGKTSDEAETEIKKWEFQMEYHYAWGSRDRCYRSGTITRSQLVSALMDIEDASREEAQKYVDFLELEIENQDVDITASEASSYFEHAKPHGISVDVYLDYKAQTNGIQNDKDANGDPIRYTAVQKIMKVIGDLPISSNQKYALAKSNGWAEKTIQKYKTW